MKLQQILHLLTDHTSLAEALRADVHAAIDTLNAVEDPQAPEGQQAEEGTQQ